MDYDKLRHFADSWGLIYLFALFIIAILFTFRPGSRKHAEEAKQIPLKEHE